MLEIKIKMTKNIDFLIDIYRLSRKRELSFKLERFEINLDNKIKYWVNRLDIF